MCENMLEDAQEIKRRLLAKGQDVDETVIHELLESFESDNGVDKAEYIINMITNDRDFCNDRNFQESSDSAEPSIVEIKSVTTKKVPKFDDQSSKMEYACTETIDIFSDSDDDRDFYYQTMDFDDISIIDTDTTDIDALLVPPQYKKMLNQVTPDSSSSQVTASNNAQNVKVESLEENNNDIYMNSASYDKNRFSESPKPGCSKDSDDIFQEFEKFCSFCNSDELQKDAKQIHAILPMFDYNLIYTILCNNQFAANRIELTLWDLLPKERPMAQLLRKRKSSDNICSVECKRNLNTFSKQDPVDSRTILKKYQAPVENETKVTDIESRTRQFILPTDSIDRLGETPENKIDITGVKSKHREPTLMDKTLMDKSDKTKEDTIGKTIILDNVANNINRSKVPIRKAKLFNKLKTLVNTEVHVFGKESSVSSEVSSKNNELQSTKNSAIPYKMEASSSEDVVSTGHHLLRPAKFTFGNISMPTSSSVPSYFRPPILAPPKLKHIPTTSPQIQVNTMVTHKDKNNIHIQCVTKVSNISSPENKISDANVAQSSGIFAITDSQNKTQSNIEAKLATNADNIVAPITLPMIKSAENNAWPMDTLNCKTLDFLDDMIKFYRPTMENYQQGREIKDTVQVRNIRDETKDFGSLQIDQDGLIGIEMNANKVKQEEMPNASHKEIILNKKARDIYYKLIPMFPGIKTDYIKRLCYDHVKEDLIFNEPVLLQNLVEQLLNCDQEHPYIKNVAKPLPQEDFKNYDVNEQYANLLGIFPEADPVYLRKVAEQIYNDPEQIKQFVQSKLENPDYPTRAQYLAKKKITEQQKQYTTGFQITQFLEIFPDPFSYFEDAKRQCQFNPYAVDFLKHYFSKIRVITLLSTYSQFGHNLSLTAKALETISSNMKNKRYSNKTVLTEDIPLLQECAFIAHKAELRKYLDDMKVKEEEEFQELKEKGELLECQCCYDDECMPSKCSTCENGHIFCNSCIVKSTDIILGEGKTHIYCLLNCGNEFPLFVLQQVLSPTKFSILLCKRQEAEVMAAGVEGLVSCPFCHFASIPPPEDKVFKCLNPDCMKESCRLCKELNHVPLKCDEMKSDVARLYLEEKMTEALVRKCYRCGRTFFKEEGCNKMTCVCGAQMCYICDKPVTNYEHFQGQGSTRSNLCPLWTDDRVMNAKAVITVCNETMKQIKEKNPDVNINVNALLPKLPPKSKGPHEDTAYANVVPERANRIARQIP